MRFTLTFRENLRTLAASETEAATDALTGLGNRRALMRRPRRLAGEATRERPLLLALFDLDGFKSYNDTFGHPAGDALLHRLGGKLEVAVGERRASPTASAATSSACSPRAPDHGSILARAAEALSEPASASPSAAPTARRS